MIPLKKPPMVQPSSAEAMAMATDPDRTAQTPTSQDSTDPDQAQDSTDPDRHILKNTKGGIKKEDPTGTPRRGLRICPWILWIAVGIYAVLLSGC